MRTRLPSRPTTPPALVALSLALAAPAARADVASAFAPRLDGAAPRGEVSVVIENDCFADSDDGYTSGFPLRRTRAACGCAPDRRVDRPCEPSRWASP